MGWEDVLKISTEEAIRDAKRFAPKEIAEAQEEENKKSRQDIINEWEKMGLSVHYSEAQKDYEIIVPMNRYNEPRHMMDSHFYILLADPNGLGFIVKMPKYPYTGTRPFDYIGVYDKMSAQRVGRTYLDRYKRAVKDYKKDEG
tara:strand:- start:18 stop:446 length:429 start_codon:yes stop_codon:yes gene_type:complete